MAHDLAWSIDKISQDLSGNDDGGGQIGIAIELGSYVPNLLAPTDTPDSTVLPNSIEFSRDAVGSLPVWQWQSRALPAGGVHQPQAQAPTITWAVNADGNWSTSADWSTGQLPGSADIVGINTAALHTVTFSTGTATVLELDVGNDNFVVSGGQLTISGAASFANALTISGGSLTVGGAFTGTTVNDTGSSARLWFTGPETIDNVTVNLGSSSSGSALGETGTGTLALGANATIDQAGTYAWLGYAPSWGTGSGRVSVTPCKMVSVSLPLRGDSHGYGFFT